MKLEKNFVLYNVFGVWVTAVTVSQLIQEMCIWTNRRTHTRTIAVTGMHGIVEAQHNPHFKAALDTSDAVVPDGAPLVWLGRQRGLELRRRVYGPELMLEFCRYTAGQSCRHYFYGGAPGVAEKLAGMLQKSFPGLQVAGTFSPPFRPLTAEEDAQIMERINLANPDVLWVGLGTPKQEIWMNEHRSRLHVPVIVTVGAAFDINSGLKKQAPLWMRENGLEWLFRLAQEPKRLWKRYLLYGSEFLFRLGAEWLGLRKDPSI